MLLSSTPADAISVLVPTYRRSQDLRRCLVGLVEQTAPPQAVVVVARRDDVQAHDVVSSFEGRLPLTMTLVERPGQVQALNAGLAQVRTPLVAITDDDSRPHPDWIERVLGHFADPLVGAVGGRDIVHFDGVVVEGSADAVGRLSWFGRPVGNHHLRSGLQETHFLKGVNMSYRCEHLPGFDENLAGAGSQICNDMQASLRVFLRGRKVVWDPCVAVDHFPASRFDEDDRHAPTLRAVANVLHNQTYILLSGLGGWRKGLAFTYGLLVGTRLYPGPLAFFAAVAANRGLARSVFGFKANWQGRLRGLRTYVRTRGRPSFPGELSDQWWLAPGPATSFVRRALP